MLHLGGRGLRLGLAAVAVAAILLSGIGVASRSAVPGSLLYPVKELFGRVAVDLAGSPYVTGQTFLRQAEGHLRDARALAAAHAPAGPVDTSLTAAVSDVRSAQREFALDDARNGKGRGRLALHGFAVDVLPRLDLLRPLVPPAARPTVEELADLLRPYAAGSGLPAAVPGTASATSGAPATAIETPSSQSPTTSGVSGVPGVPVSPTSPVKTSSGAGGSLPAATVTVGPTGGGVVPTPTVGPVSPTVSITLPTPPVTVPTTPAPFAVGDRVRILAAPVAGVVGLEGTVAAVDAAHGAVTVQVSTPPLGLVRSVTVPYGSVRRS